MAGDPARTPQTIGAPWWRRSVAPTKAAVDADELSRLGLALELTGRSDEAVHAWDRAHRAHAAAGDRAAAARCVFWIGFTLDSRGRGAQTGAWEARLVELAADEPVDSPIVALLALARAASRRHSSDGGDPIPLFKEAARLANVTATPTC